MNEHAAERERLIGTLPPRPSRSRLAEAAGVADSTEAAAMPRRICR